MTQDCLLLTWTTQTNNIKCSLLTFLLHSVFTMLGKKKWNSSISIGKYHAHCYTILKNICFVFCSQHGDKSTMKVIVYLADEVARLKKMKYDVIQPNVLFSQSSWRYLPYCQSTIGNQPQMQLFLQTSLLQSSYKLLKKVNYQISLHHHNGVNLTV